MKKRVLIFVLIVGMAMMVGCSSPYGKYQNKISEIRNHVFEGNCNNFTVSAVSGEREQPFEIDGEPGERIDFTVITIKPKIFDISSSYDYKLIYDGNEFTGEFVRHPFNETYSAEISLKITSDFILKVNGDECEITMQSIKTDNFISAKKAFDVAVEKLKSTIKQLDKYEIYIRLTKNPVNDSEGYYWYVAFVDGQNTYAVLIEPETANIIASKEME